MESATALSTVRAVTSSFLGSSKDPKFSHLSSPKPGHPVIRCFHSQNPCRNSVYPLKLTSITPFHCSAVTSKASESGNLTSSSTGADSKLRVLIEELQSLTEPVDRVKKLLHYAELLPSFEDSLRTTENRVPGCTARVWIHVQLDSENRLRFLADSDSEITKGYCACLFWVLDGATPEEVLAVSTEDLGALSVIGLNGKGRGYSSSRANTWHNVLMSLQKRTKALMARREGRLLGEPFPSLIVSTDGIQAKGSYAEAQVKFSSRCLFNARPLSFLR